MSAPNDRDRAHWKRVNLGGVERLSRQAVIQREYERRLEKRAWEMSDNVHRALVEMRDDVR